LKILVEIVGRLVEDNLACGLLGILFCQIPLDSQEDKQNLFYISCSVQCERLKENIVLPYRGGIP